MTDKEVMQLALEWIEAQPEPRMIGAWERIKALRAALAQPELEPVAWLDSDGFPWSDEGIACRSIKDTYKPLYTTPPQREWQGLTAEELEEIAEFHFHGALSGREFYDDIEAKLKEKNNG